MKLRKQRLACSFALTSLSLSIACGIAVHNEITYRSLEHFKPKTRLEQAYKDDMINSPSYTQAGSFFPDWGYQCLGNNEQAEDAHWPTFIKTAINYIRDTYPASQFHSDPHVKGLIAFVFAIMSHGMADVQWHSLRGLGDYFIMAMANSDFNGNLEEAHMAADTGAEFALRHSTRLSYLNETWQVPIRDIIEIYKRLYSSTTANGANRSRTQRRVPLASHIQYCMTAAFAASRIDVEFGRYMFGYYGSKSPFLVEETIDYYKGGISYLAGTVTDCYSEVVNAFEQGASHQEPDMLCASFFRTTMTTSSSEQHCNRRLNYTYNLSPDNDAIDRHYDPETGVYTITWRGPSLSNHDDLNKHTESTSLPAISHTVTDSNIPDDANGRLSRPTHQQMQHLQQPFQNPVKVSADTITKNTLNANDNREISTKGATCVDLFENDAYAAKTFTLLSEPTSQLGFQIVSGHFLSKSGEGQNGNKTSTHIVISAPYYQQKGAVFILNKEDLVHSTTNDDENDTASKHTRSVGDIRELAQTILVGDIHQGRFGWSVTTMDVNQDGLDDLIISTPFQDENDKREGGKIEIYLSLPLPKMQHTERLRRQKEQKTETEQQQMTFRKIELQITSATSSQKQEQHQSQFPLSVLGTVLVGIDGEAEGQHNFSQENDSNFKKLVIGCPLCSVGVESEQQYRHQTGRVYIFKSSLLLANDSYKNDTKLVKQPDLVIENPNLDKDSSNYDHFGESILFMQKTGILLIGAPGYSTKNKQRVGRVYAFEARTNKLKWIATGSREFQQYGKVLATNAQQNLLAISSPSEETRFKYHQKYWQAGAVRIYDWNKIMSIFDDKQGLQADVNEEERPIELDIEEGMRSIMLGRTNAGHLGQSLFLMGHELWVGEPMADQENGRVYIWKLDESNDGLECMKTTQRRLERFGSQIGPFVGSSHHNMDMDGSFVCITSQRFGPNNAARYTGAVNCFAQKSE